MPRSSMREPLLPTGASDLRNVGFGLGITGKLATGSFVLAALTLLLIVAGTKAGNSSDTFWCQSNCPYGPDPLAVLAFTSFAFAALTGLGSAVAGCGSMYALCMNEPIVTMTRS